MIFPSLPKTDFGSGTSQSLPISAQYADRLRHIAISAQYGGRLRRIAIIAIAVAGGRAVLDTGSERHVELVSEVLQGENGHGKRLERSTSSAS